ncbi:MAG: hypothetical protein M3Y35_17300 [Actinomycetota bacterium]|nr:hypothetical protein [Actinomycetota bacterium]
MMVAAVSAPIQVFGVTLVGISRTSGVKLLFTVALVILVLLLRRVAIGLARRLLGGAVADNRRFWTRQGIQVIAAGVLILGVVSVWVTPTTNVSTGIGLVSAGLAFALQQVTNARNWFTPTDSSAAAMECAATPTSTPAAASPASVTSCSSSAATCGSIKTSPPSCAQCGAAVAQVCDWPSQTCCKPAVIRSNQGLASTLLVDIALGIRVLRVDTFGMLGLESGE